MFDRRYFHILITVILFKNSYQHLLSFEDFPEERDVEPATCGPDNNGMSYCVNCVQSRFCFNDDTFDTPCSGSKPYCGLDTSSPPKYACVASNVDCECPGTDELSYMSDPFNSHFYATCYGTERITVDCGSQNYYNPEMNDCSGIVIPPPPCTGTGTFEDADPTTCDGFVLCSEDEFVTSGKCTSPKSYFNPVISNCDFPIQPFRCQPDYIGYYSDPFDCKRYYLCNGDALITAECCGAIEDWNNEEQKCMATTNPPFCTAALPCASDSATISTEMNTLAPTNPLTSTSDSTSSSSSTEPSVSASSSSSTEPSVSASSSSSTEPSVSASSSSSTEPSVSASTSSSAATTSPGPSCIPLSSYTCTQPDGYFPQCNYCARTYFQCISGTATLRTCTGNGVFNTVPEYAACLSPEYCPYYP